MTEPNNMVTDLIALQKALPVMPKDTSNTFFKSKYTSLDTITELIFPIMTKHNFAWTTLPSFNEAGEPTLKYSLMHSSGDVIHGEMKLVMKAADPQGQGSAITYARRYAITSVLGIVGDADDDGNAARVAAQAAKGVDEHRSPEEPSRQLTDEPISPQSMEKVKLRLRAKGYTGTKVTDFVQFLIDKPAPTTEADASELLKALESK